MRVIYFYCAVVLCCSVISTAQAVEDEYVSCRQYEVLIDILHNDDFISDSELLVVKCLPEFVATDWDWSSNQYSDAFATRLSSKTYRIGFPESSESEAIRFEKVVKDALNRGKSPRLKIKLTNMKALSNEVDIVSIEQGVTQYNVARGHRWTVEMKTTQEINDTSSSWSGSRFLTQFQLVVE
ncbi:hypothetical protein ACPV47_18520 [Vibrio jasicida]|uniref:hypothetical protein n=1 Tax=Vibrio jasicida TaxID=766224 RepID=UPI0040691148